jgi:hypothetical protein
MSVSTACASAGSHVLQGEMHQQKARRSRFSQRKRRALRKKKQLSAKADEEWVDPFDAIRVEFQQRHQQLIAGARKRIRFQYIRIMQGFNSESCNHHPPDWEHATVTLSMNDMCFMSVPYTEFATWTLDGLCAFMTKYAPYCEKGSDKYVRGYTSSEEWD